ncbi:tRNA 2-selenouridine(34) synthase MnmH [Lutimaribacter sp. EGI FJ00015]|uniref:tRNA 2-selenouridine(34) synthase MnmH n=1 Tax=Lutimaribacter degradans TaxID=2945989 RepID=A0ACC5ZYG2_9RHOB|nr:tRNA 2-selenouridine(34) synthase MnmH [Lutimaribacter sp. EGI FJ00013]MCM2562865.1 tRNA 2-selenouridine(34) synthase MnmH [Lutimaribacter sp. EGI FJ00013]MCO0614022.1 tRNA 2-selenouridine(34) synthase MnmH [Lutimaribacter sp. EGI FJ00015]MCO0636994.1 tRNA 2-selenouridine(34) synthase MnmH [Lutimaribacter sp. EGI FJ00014]
MAIALTSLDQLASLPFDEIIDVRSPAEYAEDHVPGAINLPALDNDERAIVGTIYTQDDPFKARKVGAALVAQNAARHLQGPLADRQGGWRPLVYCWRGGQRSGSFTSILQQIGWRADTVQGGYKAYRRLVVQALYNDPVPHRVVLIDGGTGTAKTRLLELLAEAGAQVIDLEGLANHRGSLFGSLGAQPAQKMLESRIANALVQADPARPLFIEAESAKVGDLLIPPSLWHAMRVAPRITVQAPIDARAAYLVRAYADMTEDAARLAETLEALRPYQGAKQVEAWQELAAKGAFEQLARQLITTHYDPRYAKKPDDRATPETVLSLNALDDDSLRAAVPRIISIAG